MTADQVTEIDRPRLSKAAVVERGLALGDAEGLEAVTIRRLAAELGVTPMALYWHFRNKDELLTGLADAVWAELDLRLDPRDDWPVQLRGLLESLVGVLRRHPSASQLLIGSEKRTSDAAMLASETALGVLDRGGFDAEYSAAIVRNALFTGVMLAMSEPGFEPGRPEAERVERMRQFQVRLALLPPDRFPMLVAAAGPMTACDNPDFHYRVGIDLFIAGVRALSQQVAAGHAKSARGGTAREDS
ncbi:MAG TPA: TetR family transcriptional regulator [Streptosporangiaceae bacterium]|nr:TetR family transcriptional regulator [Streptosporangiaceae bacterium]